MIASIREINMHRDVVKMKRFYIITVVLCLLFVLFYVYGLSVDQYQSGPPPAAVAAAAGLP